MASLLNDERNIVDEFIYLIMKAAKIDEKINNLRSKISLFETRIVLHSDDMESMRNEWNELEKMSIEFNTDNNKFNEGKLLDYKYIDEHD